MRRVLLTNIYKKKKKTFLESSTKKTTTGLHNIQLLHHCFVVSKEEKLFFFFFLKSQYAIIEYIYTKVSLWKLKYTVTHVKRFKWKQTTEKRQYLHTHKKKKTMLAFDLFSLGSIYHFFFFFLVILLPLRCLDGR